MKKTLVDLFEGSVANYPNNTFLKEKIGKEWTDTTYAQVRDNALGKVALRLNHVPENITDVVIEPAEVDYLIEVNALSSY